MQTSSVNQPEAILDWLQKEMGYRPLGPYLSSNKPSMPSSDAIRKVCRGNMIPVFDFLLKRVKSEKTVINIRRNIVVHGTATGSSKNGDVGKGKKKTRGRNIEITNAEESHNRETAMRERESAEKEVKRLRHIVRGQRKELKARMLEVSREEADRKRILDERLNSRHKQVMLEAYYEQCDEATRIFAQYHKCLCSYVNRVKTAQRLEADSTATSCQVEAYSTVKGSKPAEDVILIETSRERNIQKACEFLAVQMNEKINNSFPAYKGSGIHLNPLLETAKLGIDVDRHIPDEIRDVILNFLKCPPQFLRAVTTYTQRWQSLIAKEIEKSDVRADAERLRYKLENNTVTDASHDVGTPLQLQLYVDGNIGIDMPSNGTENQLLERQKAHVLQFVATEDQLNKAAEAKSMCQKLLKRLSGSSNSSFSLGIGGTSQNMSSLRLLELDVWAKEREAAGLRASLITLMSEVQRLHMLCEERKEAEDFLNKKWKKIEEFDARRLELKSIYDALMRANTDAAAFWSQQPLLAREHASDTIIPACTVVVNIASSAKDLIDKEVSAFSRSPDNTFYMLPSTPQALLESMGPNGSTGPEAVTSAEKNAALLTARAGVGDPSAIPSICRVSAALQYPAGLEGAEASFRSVLESMEFCLKLRGSEACVLEDLSKAMDLVHIRRDLVGSGHALLNHAYHAQKEYKRTTSHCLDLASEQDEIIAEKWMPELKNGVTKAQNSVDDCKYVSVLLDDWWEQPASTIVDWVTVDGQNVAAWHNHVKQLLAVYDKEFL